MTPTIHVPVLYEEALAGLNIVPNGSYVDGTVGAGGHAAGILQASAPHGRLLGLDRDPRALEISRQNLAAFGDRVTLIHSSFAKLKETVRTQGFGPVDGVLLDLGVSSMQLSDPDRGFSFQQEGPLDMRFDPDSKRTAADVVNTLSERNLADLIYRYGEEPAARSISRAIVAARPLHTTAQLAQVVLQGVRKRGRHAPGRRHPATRTFQAIRIAVNNELEILERGLEASLAVLKPGGRLAVIAFHSLEDRIVKRFFAHEARDCVCPPEAAICTCGHQASIARETRKPVRPSVNEIAANPRSRSAKLRIVTKLRTV
jgi:16S rRNA (cytosine1402-N4)-methyltransferase